MKTVACWAYAAHAASAHHLPVLPREPASLALASEALLSCATINIKKSSGRSASDWDDLRSYASRDGNLLRKQVDLINPRLVICGKVWPLIHANWPNVEQVYDRVWDADGRVFIDFWHPANQFPNDLNYYALGALLQSSGAVGRCETVRDS